MAKAVVISAVLLPLLSIPLIYGLSKLDMLKKQPVFLSGLLGALVITFGGTALFFYRNFKKVDPIMHGKYPFRNLLLLILYSNLFTFSKSNEKYIIIGVREF